MCQTKIIRPTARAKPVPGPWKRLHACSRIANGATRKFGAENPTPFEGETLGFIWFLYGFYDIDAGSQTFSIFSFTM